jgi:uncharacterized protein (UPF0276 family)
VRPSERLAEPVGALEALPKLGVGLLYNPALPGFLRDHSGTYDYVEVIPEMFWTDRGPGAEPRFVELEPWIEMLDWMRERVPVTAHGIGLALGSADHFDPLYAEQVAAWQARFGFPWHSDHLSLVRITSAEGLDHNTGLAVPVPYDHEVVDLIAERIEVVQRIVQIPFLIENDFRLLDAPDQDLSEPEFLNALTARTGCGLLLDIHHVYANARNHGFDAWELIAELDASRIIEIHIAGGSKLAGVYTDSHAGPCPPEVWELLERVVPSAANLAAITFEFHDAYYPLLKAEGIRAELDRAREIWERRSAS